MKRIKYNPVEIRVPGSTANLGLYFDGAGAALSSPLLVARLEPTSGPEIELHATSRSITPSGRNRGHAGRVALTRFMQDNKIKQGVRLTFEDADPKRGFPTGGTGLSGAEAAGAVVAAAVMFDRPYSQRQMVIAAAKGEPNEHMDNVAPSVMGGIVFISADPCSSEKLFHRVSVPQNLGFAMGFSSHPKIGGTESTRNILKEPVISDVHVEQVNRASVAALSLQAGNVDNFLKLVSGDRYHEPRRADAGLYGNFNAMELFDFKKDLYSNYKVALAVSGAGPNMQFWFDKSKHPERLPPKVKSLIVSWFGLHKIAMDIHDVKIAKKGAYAYAQQQYPNSRLAQGK